MPHPKRYPVAAARERLAEVLDAAEAGSRVFIERRGVRFAVTVQPARDKSPAHRRTPALIRAVEADIADGQWGWGWTPEGLEPTPPRPR